MKNILTLALIFGISVYFKPSMAQSQIDHRSYDYRSSLALQAVSSDLASSKTTYTVRKIKGASRYNSGSLDDSFLVTMATMGGTSKLNYLDFYVNNDFDINKEIEVMYNPYNVDFADFSEAIHYSSNSYAHADSISRTMNSQGKTLTSRLKFYNNIQSLYTLRNTTNDYDSLNRIFSQHHEYDNGVSGLYERDISWNYAANGKYIIASIDINDAGNVYSYRDSLSLDNGKLIYHYSVASFDTTPVIGLYSYNANKQLTGILKYYGSDLTGEVIISPRSSNSDFPDAASSITYSDVDVKGVIMTYNFNASTGRLIGAAARKILNLDTTDYSISFVNNADGDIQKSIWIKTATGDTATISNIYYDDQPSGVFGNPKDVNDLKAYPVPTQNTVNIQSSGLFDSYSLYDQSGRLLESKNFNKTQTKEISIGRYSPGIYFVEVLVEGKSQNIAIEKR